VALLIILSAAVFAGAFAAGSDTDSGSGAPPDAVVLDGGVPVGVLATGRGAVAAGAEYAAVVQRTSALDPPLFDRVVRGIYTGRAGQRVLALARDARLSDPPLSGIHLLTAVAGARLDELSGRSASIAVWLEAAYWSRTIPPTQIWALEQLELRWHDGRWRVAAQTERAAPVPARATVRDRNDTSSAFDEGLTGMTAVDYGAP
jgi:hypothetical protein